MPDAPLTRIANDFMNDLSGIIAAHLLEGFAQDGVAELRSGDVEEVLSDDYRESLHEALDASYLPAEVFDGLIDAAYAMFVEQVNEDAYVEGAWDPQDYLRSPAAATYDDLSTGFAKVIDVAERLSTQAHDILSTDDQIDPPDRDRLAYGLEMRAGIIREQAEAAIGDIVAVASEVV